jgi:hypothetical protein
MTNFIIDGHKINTNFIIKYSETDHNSGNETTWHIMLLLCYKITVLRVNWQR